MSEASNPCQGVTDLWSLTEVTCNYADFKVKVPKCVFDETLFDGSPLSDLLEEDLFISGSARPGNKCFGKIDDDEKYVFFDVGKNPETCGVKKEDKTYENKNHNRVLEYSANIQYEIGESNDIIKRTRSINLPFSCHFPLDFSVASAANYKAKRQEINYETKGKVITTEVTSGLFKDETWGTQLTGDQVFEVPTPIHVGFSTPNDEDKFKIKLKKCWATPESNPNHEIKYVFLDNWCGNKAELDGETLKVYNLEHSAGFAIEAFTWKDQTCSDIFIHCEIVLCEAGQDCDTAPQCNERRKRREADKKNIVVGGNKVKVCGDATFPLEEGENKSCPEKVDLKWPENKLGDIEGTYILDTNDMSYRKPNSNWAIKPDMNDFVIHQGDNALFWINAECSIGDSYKYSATTNPVVGLEVTEHKEKEGEKVEEKEKEKDKEEECPAMISASFPAKSQPSKDLADGIFRFDKDNMEYVKVNTNEKNKSYRLVYSEEDGSWLLESDGVLHFQFLGEACPHGQDFVDYDYNDAPEVQINEYGG